MTRTIEAIYENGLLRPLQQIEGIAEHSRVRLRLEDAYEKLHPLADCFGLMSDEDAAEMTRIIESEFERVNPDDWR